MLGLKSLLHTSILPRRASVFPPQPSLASISFSSKATTTYPRRFHLLLALNNSNSNNGNNNPSRDPNQQEPRPKRSENNDGGGDGSAEERRPPLFNLKWSDLLFDPDPDNIVAVGLTGLLTWASVQVLWQLFFISLAILLAALKYSFIAALLIFILVTLL